MIHFRRSLIWIPLVALTLFFGACGWRNWHLQMDEEEILVQCAEIALEGARENYYSIVCEDCDADSLASELHKRHPQVQFKGIKSGNHVARPTLWLSPFHPSGYFKATCIVENQGATQVIFRQRPLTFTRSPFVFWDSRWHLKDFEPERPNLISE